MKYKTKIKGIHCQGCASLIKLCMEDEGLSKIDIDVQNGEATFESNEKDIEIVQKSLKKSFENLKTYTYSDLSFKR